MRYSKNKFHFIFGLAAGTTAFCVTLMPHTLFLENLENTVAFYRYGVRVPVNNKLKKLCQEVMDDLEIPKSSRSLIKPFHVFGFESYYAGTTIKKYGGIIGIPINFTYTDAMTIPTRGILVNHKPLEVDKKESDDLLNSLVLSENAQKYAIAFGILKIQSKEVYLVAFNLANLVLIGTKIYSILVHKYSLYDRRSIYRYILVLSTILIILILWLVIKDGISCNTDSIVDEQICELGLNYIQGGKEFYEKEIQRNIALRELMGENGKKLYSLNGNTEYLFRQKTAPLSYRKSFFESKL